MHVIISPMKRGWGEKKQQGCKHVSRKRELKTGTSRMEMHQSQPTILPSMVAHENWRRGIFCTLSNFRTANPRLIVRYCRFFKQFDIHFSAVEHSLEDFFFIFETTKVYFDHGLLSVGCHFGNLNFASCH